MNVTELQILTIKRQCYTTYNPQARNHQRHVGLAPLFMLISALALGSKLEGGARAERLAISVVDDPADTFVPFGTTTFVNETRLTRLVGLASNTRLILGASPLAGESCGIMLDRLLPFSFRGPTMDRLLPPPLLPSPALEPPLPIFAAGGRGSRDFETLSELLLLTPPLEVSNWFMTSDSTR